MKHVNKNRLLLVEDDVILTLAESKILVDSGYEVRCVASGEDAIEVIKNDNGIDLILMDIDLGSGINGLEASRQILKIKDLPIVFLTSCIDKKIIHQMKFITRYGYIVKGSGEKTLLSSIEMAIGLFQSRKTIEAGEARYHQFTGNIVEVIRISDLRNKRKKI